MVSKIAMIGLGPMGKSLSLNMLDKGIDVVGFDISEDARANAQEEGINTVSSIEEAVDSFDGQKAFWVMVPDTHVDEVLEDLSEQLDKEDILIEGGNSFYKDTRQRVKWANEKGLYFIGTGVSGGEEGARKGPSIMPGGDKEAYDAVSDILEKIAADVDGDPCVDYMGPEGAGHFVKMVHNGIEYAIIEAVVEAYHIMLHAGVSYEKMHEKFTEWSESHYLGGFLTEITADILGTEDPKTGKPKVETILDTASQKGTGRWTSKVGMDMGVPVELIGDAVSERTLSSFKDLREKASHKFNPELEEYQSDEEELFDMIEKSLYAAILTAYAQGFEMLGNCRYADEKLCGHKLDLATIAKIWRGGCIIRANLLEDFRELFNEQPNVENILITDKFSKELEENIPDLRDLICHSHKMGVPVTVLGDTLSYYDSLRHERLPSAAMIQAMRDYFGSHTYHRVDDEKGTYHTLWSEDKSEVKLN